ncbi:MAG: hypothetical protein KBC73_09190 [Burkholderiaceae bacterium]|nr:hypothetical protein [Burkholderiaceae bacterium]
MSPAAAVPQIRLLADDLTGALDSAAAFAGSVHVHLDQAPERGADEGVQAVATATRDVAVAALPQRLAGVLDWLAGAGLAFKKVDSLLRGNTFAECAWLARSGGFDGLVFAPAFPAQGRLTQAAQQYLLRPAAAAAAAPGEAQRTPVGPAIDQAFAALGLAVCRGAEPPPPGAAGAGPVVWVPDVLGDADLLQLALRTLPGAQALPGRWLWCGSAGLAQALAAARLRVAANSHPAATPPQPVPPPPARGRPAGALMLGASHHPVVRRQWARLRQAWPQALQVEAGDARQFAAACEALRQPFDVAALELSPLQPLDAQQAALLLQQQLAQLLACMRRPGLLLVVGGDSLLACCRASGARSLRTLAALRPGWGHALLVGGAWDGLECHSRSGAFGDDDDLQQMLAQSLAG